MSIKKLPKMRQPRPKYVASKVKARGSAGIVFVAAVGVKASNRRRKVRVDLL